MAKVIYVAHIRDSRRILDMYSSSFFSFEKATRRAPIMINIRAISSVKLFSTIFHKDEGGVEKVSGNNESTLKSRKENSKFLKITMNPNIAAGISKIQPIIRNLFGNKKFAFIHLYFND